LGAFRAKLPRRYNRLKRNAVEQQKHREMAVDILMYMLPVYLPFYQAMLVAGVGRAVVLLLLAVLLMFLVTRRADVVRAIASCLRALPSSWLAPAPEIGFRELSFASLSVPNAPSLAPLFQRPPPLFA
jgi:hypothetical protein